MNPAGCGHVSEQELEVWLDGRLRRERLDEIEQHARGCGACALLLADVGTFRSVASGASDEESREFEARRQMLEARLQREVKSTKRNRWPWVTIAAAASVLAVFLLMPQHQPGGVVTIGRQTMVIDALPFSAAPLTRGAPDGTAWGLAAASYRASDYNAAGRQFEAIATREPESVDAALYAGIAYFFDGRPKQSKPLLETARERAVKQDQPVDVIAYYQGVAALALDNTDEARRQLSTAAEGASPWKEKAQELLSQL